MLLYGGAEPWMRDVTTEQLVAMAQRADELGFDLVDVSTHFVMHKDLVGNMGPRWPHSPSMTGFLLGATERIKVLCKLIVPNHNAVELAKTLATLDWASGGRLIAAPMVGYMDWEFEILNVPFEQRGPMMDEYLAAMVELWTANEPEFEGQFVSFRDIVFDPKPVQRPLPLWFGARTRLAARRIARWGHGWVSSPSMTVHARIPSWLEDIRSQPAFAESPRPLEVYAPLLQVDRDPYTHEVRSAEQPLEGKDEILERIALISGYGVTTVIASVGRGATASFEAFLDGLQWYAEEIIPEARDL
jgi:alkanesulfonate monooxygenase SsuD/methylene tetrahydromethanopterin reductase-like flavin-dependent oxidoreductase (luciferase family)